MRESGQHTDTTTLRSIWTHSAAKIVEGIRDGRAVDANEVEKLQKALEGIEAREELDHLNAIAQGEDAARA